jgi:hypothetical protein
MPNKYHGNLSEPKPNKSVDPESWEQKVCKQVIDEWDKGKTYTSSLNEMYEDLYLMMRGKRPKKKYDWQSDITLRKAFQVVWKMVSYVSQKIYGSYPVIGVSGFDKKGCWQRETLLETWMEEDKYFMVVVQGLLRLGLNGTMIGKKNWRQTLKAVKNPQGQVQQFPMEDRPEDIILNNKDVVCDWLLRPGQAITEGRFIIHREVVDMMTLFNSKIKYINLDEVSTDGTAGRTDDASDHGRVRAQSGQADIPESDLYSEVEKFERQGLWPVKVSKKGKITPIFDPEEIYSEGTEWKQMLACVADKETPVLIRWEENPYGEMNYFDGQLYLDPERWQSQGVVEPAKDVMIAQDDNINAMFDEIWHNLFPPIIVNKYAQAEWDTIKWAPSQMWQAAGNPAENFMITKGSNITTDAWQKHALLEGEIQTITPVTHNIAGAGKENTATLGALNATFSSAQLDFVVKMVEVTWLIPSSKMTLRFAQKFGHPMTFLALLGEPFQFDQYLEEYKFRPCASSVKMPEQRERQIQENLQLLQVIAPIQNPNTPKMINYLIGDILRCRNQPQLATMLREDYFEPQTPAGQMQQLINPGIQPGAPSNEKDLAMSASERMTRAGRFTPRGQMLQ